MRSLISSLTCQRIPRSLSRRRFATLRLDSDTGRVTSSDGTHSFQTIIGLEVHAQLDIATKLFSNAPSKVKGPPNAQIMPFDVAVPGFLPRLSQEAVQSAVLAAAALNCDIQTVSRFERKHYTYADLPLGYQITQQRWPLAVSGRLVMDDGVSCRVNRIQLEMDTAKTTSYKRGSTVARVDFQRAGNALIEIVLEPDLCSPQQAVAAVTTLRQLLRHAQVCDGRMNEGSLRVDLNVNVAFSDSKTPRVEVKNLNSIQQVHDAAVYEVLRQSRAALEQSEELVMETRTWNPATQQTLLMRRKDLADDYRFMPEPDLPPLVLTKLDGLSLPDFLRKRLPELPAAAIQRLQDEHGLTDYQVRVIAGDPSAVQFLDDAIMEGGSPKTIVNLLINDLFALVKEHHSADLADEEEPTIAHCPLSGHQLGILAVMLDEEEISSTQGKKLLRILYDQQPEMDPRTLAAERGFQLVTDTDALRQLVESVVAQHLKELGVYRKGGKFVTKMTKLFTGKAMAASKGNAHPERLVEVVRQVLKEKASE